MRFLLPALALIGALSPAGAVEDRPNVVIFFIDDQGYYDLGCYGATEVATPRIDQLAKEGIRFTDHYAAAPICSPSRAGLLTGAYPRRIGLETWVQRADSTRGIHPDEVTLAELFKTQGYATACVGKWHLGDLPSFVPQAQGFDSHFGLYANLDPVETAFFGEAGVPLLRNGEIVKRPADPAELTRLYTDEAIAFVEKHRETPFFLYLPHTMLHEPIGVSPEFQGRTGWGDYGDAIEELDHHVGRFMDRLAALGLDQKTIVLYASDNGRGPGRNADQPMKGNKLSTWECGLRVPAILRAPRTGSHAGRGLRRDRQCARLVSHPCHGRGHPHSRGSSASRRTRSLAAPDRESRRHSPALGGTLAERGPPPASTLGTGRGMEGSVHPRRLPQRVFPSRKRGCPRRGAFGSIQDVSESGPDAL